MKPFIPTLVLAVGVSSALLAQTEAPRPPAQQPMASDAFAQKPATSADAISVTGCVREAVDQPRLFVLVSDPASGAANPVYRLEGTKVDLKTHVAHLVRISGTLSKSMASSDTLSGKVPASITSAEVKDTPKLMVTTVQPVADACPTPSK
jgi:hypothetical protein